MNFASNKQLSLPIPGTAQEKKSYVALNTEKIFTFIYDTVHCLPFKQCFLVSNPSFGARLLEGVTGFPDT